MFNVIVAPPTPAPTGAEIRAMRNEAGLTQTQLALTVELTLMQVSRIERGQLRRGDLQRRGHSALQASGTP